MDSGLSQEKEEDPLTEIEKIEEGLDRGTELNIREEAVL